MTLPALVARVINELSCYYLPPMSTNSTWCTKTIDKQYVFERMCVLSKFPLQKQLECYVVSSPKITQSASALLNKHRKI